MTRTKKVLLNFVTDFVPQIIIAFLGILKSRIFLTTWGENVSGLYQLYAQLFSYLSIVEVGISSAVLYSLYKPMTDKDNNKVKEIYNGANLTFNIIGSIIIVLGLGLSFFVGSFIKDNSFNSQYLQLTFLLYVLSSVFNYFFMAKKLLFYAKEKNYIPNFLYQSFTIIKSIIEIILVLLKFDLLYVLILGVLINLLTNFVLLIYYRKNFSYLPSRKKRIFPFISDLKSVSLYKISNLISNNIDIVLISKIIGLKNVVVYTSYHYIVLSIQLMTDKISNAALSSVGNLLKESKNRAGELFNKFNDILFFVGTAICIPLYFCINSFIDIWYKQIVVVNNYLSFLFTTLLFINIIRQNSGLFVNAMGMFKKTQICAIIDVILNLSLTIIFINIWGVSGAVLATIISLLISEIYLKNKIIVENIFSKNYFYYLRIMFPCLLFAIINFVIIYILFSKTVITNLFELLIIGISIFMINIIMLVIEYYFSGKTVGLLLFDKKRLLNRRGIYEKEK